MVHNTHKCLPAGWTAYDPNTGKPHWFGEPGWGWATQILPYMEQTAVLEGLVHRELPITDPANEDVRVLPLQIYRCPSDQSEPTFTLQGGGIDVGSGGFSPVELAIGNYVGVFGTIDLHEVCPGMPCKGDGPFFLNHGVRFAEFVDGLSHTFVVGERCSKLAPSTWVGEVTGGQHAPARIVGVATYPPVVYTQVGLKGPKHISPGQAQRRPG